MRKLMPARSRAPQDVFLVRFDLDDMEPPVSFEAADDDEVGGLPLPYIPLGSGVDSSTSFFF